jgi:multicomponent Na+:H+ antiporter subunit G
MQTVLDILSWLAILSGGAFCIIGAIGMIRLPDVFCRMHGASIIDTLGLGLILLGLALQTGFTIGLVKLAMIFLFIMFTSPTGTHALSRAALYSGIDPEAGTKPGPRKSR